jgi:hypothetical protein
MVQFRVQDIAFRLNELVLPKTSPLAQLVLANSVTLYLDNQKNEQCGMLIHHTACPSWFCPVKALACWIARILTQEFNAATPLSQVSPGIHVIAANVTALVHQAATDTNLVTQGYDLK